MFHSVSWMGATALALMVLAACGRNSEQVGSFSNDWTGNEIKVEAVHDPDIPGIYSCKSMFYRIGQQIPHYLLKPVRIAR